jgi:hypothetical protein
MGDAKRGIVLLLSSVLASCGENLVVPDRMDPTIEQVLSTPSAIEQTIQSGYQSCHNSVETSGDGFLLPQMAVLSLEGYSAVNNFGMGLRVGIPRGVVLNAIGGVPINENFNRLSLGSRLAANAANALDQVVARGGTLGTPAQNLRARAFGFFAVGCHQGWLAMAYDSAGIVTPGMAADSIPPLSGAQEVMRAAIAMLDSAIAIASNPVSLGASGFPLPSTWVSGNALARDEFVRVVRSLRARFRPGVARTPAEREQVSWPAVIADAENGVTSDLMVTVGPSGGWSPGGNVNATLFYNVAPLYYGMADVSGGYDAWLGRPLDARDFFLIVTPDRRWPQGTTRAAQQTNSTVPTSFASRPYVANRTGTDLAGHAWGVSYYFFNRLQYIRGNGSNGAFPAITKAELDLLAAEGYLRAGNVVAAAAKIDVTRVGRGQLPALAGAVTRADQAVPGGADCVPRVPAPPAFTSTVCGTIWEAMKWEKRMETAYTGFAQWYFDARGWGDLVQGTATEFPVPYQELGARLHPYYSLGGGLRSSAAKGTYGF